MVVAATATTATLTGHGAIHTSTLLRESTTTRFCIGWASLPFACKNHEKSGALMCSSSKIRASSTTPIKAVAKEAQLASTEIDQKRRTKYHYLVANAKFMLDEEEHFNELMCERLRNYGERNKEVDFWLVIEPKFLDKFPDVTKRLRRPAVALVSTNGTWITFMKLRLDRVLQGEFEAETLEEALSSNPVDLNFGKPEKWTAPYAKYEYGWWEPFLLPPSE
uniref:Ycf54-like protein n=1 Tax=Picea sitchensis TaxID=3332 RepID=A9NLY2_PICSI|nr:unknown [Picea sitchensis]ABK22348.1 unknown [Picea sitchensis]ABK26457.1 unknown [Picea sitchensis]ACN39790.1 unknown [Picea sitchensis]